MAGSTVDPDIPIGEYHLRVSQKPVTQPSQPFDGAVTQTGTETLTNKTISGASNTLSNIASASVTGLDTHTASTAAHGATGAVVGTTNTQTLTNKTLTTPTIDVPVVTGGTFSSPVLTTPVISSTGFYYAQHDHSDTNKGGALTSYYEPKRYWTDYTPEWIAGTTNPTLGTGATAHGRYKIIGHKTVQVDIEFITGTSGFSGGSGQYRFSLPSVYNGGTGDLGFGLVRDSSIESSGTARMYNGSYYTGVCVAAKNQNYLLVYTNQTTSGSINPTVPFTWGASDQIILTCTYEFQ